MSDVFHLHQIAGDYIVYDLPEIRVKLTPLTMRGRGNLGSVFVNTVKSPVDNVLLLKGKLPEEAYQKALENAVKQQQYWPPAIDSVEALNIMAGSYALQESLLAEMLRKFQPEDCERLAKELMETLTPTEYAKIGGFGWTGRRPDEPDFMNPSAASSGT